MILCSYSAKTAKDRQKKEDGRIPLKISSACLLLFFACSLNSALWAMGSRPQPVSDEKKEVPADQPALSINEAYNAALMRSEELAIKKADIDLTWANFLEATSVALGDVSFQMEDFRQESLGGGSSAGGATGSFNRPHSRENKFVISQPLFQGFKSLGALTGTGSLRSEREYTYERAKQLLFLDVADAFYSVLQSEKAYEITGETITLLEDRVRDLSEREKIGRSRKSEVVTAKSRLNTLKANQARLQGEHKVQLRMLEFLTGLNLEGRPLELSDGLPPSQPELSRYLNRSQNRPDVEAARSALKTAKRSIVVAQSQLWPTVSLDHTQYEKREGFQSAIDWDLMLKINVPLFQGGEALGKIKEALVEKKKSDLSLSKTSRESETETKQAYDELQSRFDEYEAFDAALETAEENYKVQKEDYTLALVSNLDVLEALENLNQTRLDFNQVHFQLLKNFRNLQVASGDCCESL